MTSPEICGANHARASRVQSVYLSDMADQIEWKAGFGML